MQGFASRLKTREELILHVTLKGLLAGNISSWSEEIKICSVKTFCGSIGLIHIIAEDLLESKSNNLNIILFQVIQNIQNNVQA